jgi:hypothetical protein
MDVFAEGQLIVDNLNLLTAEGGALDPARAVVVTYEFVAGDQQLNIILNGSTGGAPDINATISGFTLEAIDATTLDTSDLYQFYLSPGDTATLALQELTGSGDLNLELLDNLGATLAVSVASATNLDDVIADFTTASGGTFFAKVTGFGDYSLVVTRDADFDTENNNDPSTAQSLDATGVVLGHVSAIGQLLGADDGNTNLLLVDPNTGTSKIIASNVGGGRGFNDLALNPVTGVLYGSQSLNSWGLYTIDTASFAESYIGDLGGNVRAMAWSPDGTTLYGFRDSQFGSIDPGTAEFTVISDPSIGFVGGMAFQPGTGTLFVVTNNRGVLGLYTLDVTTGSASYIGYPGADYNSLEFLPDGTLLAGVGRFGATPGFLVKLDPTTATPTLIGQTVPYGANNLTALEVLPATDDYYSILVNAGDSLVIGTTTPADGAGEFVNTLDPQIELIDPNGLPVASDDDGAADGRNAQLSYAALESGIYLVRVSGAKQTQGEYVLTVTGFTGSPSPSAPLAASPVASLSAAAAAAIAPVPGDVNFDGVFDSADLVQVFQIGKYEDGIDNNSSYEEGDWNGDGDFDSKDLVEVFQSGLYEAQTTPRVGAASSARPALGVDAALATDANDEALRAGDLWQNSIADDLVQSLSGSDLRRI